jgi:hypothetical protein
MLIGKPDGWNAGYDPSYSPRCDTGVLGSSPNRRLRLPGQHHDQANAEIEDVTHFSRADVTDALEISEEWRQGPG